MEDITIHISLADLVLIVTLVRALVVVTRWLIRKAVEYIWNIVHELQNHSKHK